METISAREFYLLKHRVNDKNYYNNRRDDILARNKLYYANNREKVLAYAKTYRDNNKEKIALRNKLYYFNRKNGYQCKKDRQCNKDYVYYTPVPADQNKVTIRMHNGLAFKLFGTSLRKLTPEQKRIYNRIMKRKSRACQ